MCKELFDKLAFKFLSASLIVMLVAVGLPLKPAVAATNIATKLVITSSPMTTVAGVASADITVERQDASSTPITTDADISVTLSSDSGGTYSFNPSGPLTIATGSSSVNFTYMDTLAGSHTITAASSGLASDTQAETVTPASANKLEMKTEPSSNVSAGGLFTTPPEVYVEDTYGNVVITDHTTVVTAAVKTGTGPLQGTTTATASLGVATFGALAAPLTAQTNLTLTFSATDLTSVDNTTPITVTAAAATRLVITGSGTQTAGTSQNLLITAKDDSNNTVTSYTGSKSLTFSGANSSPNATKPRVKNNIGTQVDFGNATSITFTSGVASVSGGNNGVMTLYKAEPALVCVTDGTINSAVSDCLPVGVSPAAASKLAFTSTAVTTYAGVASSTITVEREDTWGNSNTADVARTVTLTSNTIGTATFNPASPLTIAQGSSSVSFTYTDSMAGTPIITAASTVPTAITSASQQETVSAGTPKVSTSAATGVHRTGAILNGTVNAAGGSVTVTFEYGTTTAYGSTIAATPSTVTGSSPTPVSASIPGLLTPGTTYHFRIVGLAGSLPLIGSDKSFTTSAAASTTYYINNATTCSDMNPGTSPSAPFCTIGKGASVADAGDIVSVLGGTYAETVRPTNNGGTGMPITFQAAAGVTVTGEAGNSLNGGAFRLFNKGYIVMDGFTVYGTADYGIIATSSHDIVIKNNHVSYSGSPSTTLLRPGIYLTATTASTVTGNTTDHNTFDGIRLNNGSNNNLIEKNISFGNSTQISSQATGINLLKNSNYNTIIRNITYSNEDSGLNFYTGSGHNLVINNLTYGNGDHGIDNNGSPYQTIIGNTVHGNVTVGINVEQDSSGNGSGGATLMNNLCADNGHLLHTGSGSYIGHQPGNIRVDATSTSSPAASTLDYNLVYSSSAAHLVQYIWGATSYTSLFSFQAANSQDMHGLQADPLFNGPAPIQSTSTSAPFSVAIATGDYHLRTGSPAIDSANSGAPSEQTVDIEGNPRVDDPATGNTGVGTRTYDDRGAYEFQLLLPGQTITITAPNPFPTSAIYNTSFAVTATGGASGNPVTIATSGSCSGSGTNGSALITITSGIGNCIITLNQAGNSAYSPALPVTKTVAAEKAPQTITITGPDPFPTFAGFNTILTVTATGGNSGNPVSIAGSGACTGSGANGTALVTMAATPGNCTININQNGNNNYATATLSKIISVLETMDVYLPLIIH